MTGGNQYRAKGKAGEAAYSAGVFDHEFASPADERDALNNGILELVPRPYRVLSDNYQAGSPGDVFEGAFLMEIERMLIDGGHIERVRRDAAPTVDTVVDTAADVEPAPEPVKRKRATTPTPTEE